MTEEVWRDIKDYEGFFQISNFGRVKSLERYILRNNGTVIHVTEKILTIRYDIYGYQVVHLNKNGAQAEKKIHRLVAEAFIPNPENKPHIDHINCVRCDNTVWLNKDGSVNYEKTNLRWATSKENSNNLLTKKHMSESHKGKCGRQSSNHRNIFQYDLNGKIIKLWDTIKEASQQTGTNRTSIIICAKGKYKSAGNSLWRYPEDQLADWLEEIQDEDMAA